MSENYHYEDGAIHHDHKKVLHIDTLNGGDIGKLISAFFKTDAEEAEYEEVTEVKEEEDETGARIKNALDVLQKEKLLKNLYDYTWVMEAMNQTAGMPNFDTPNSFITYLRGLNVERLPSEDTIQVKQNKFVGEFPNWKFTDCDTREATRRINVGKRFLNAYRSK